VEFLEERKRDWALRLSSSQILAYYFWTRFEPNQPTSSHFYRACSRHPD
jgi:hypothetical protein